MSADICLHCCLERGRQGGCRECGPGAPGKDPEPHPLCIPPGTLLKEQYLIGRVLGSGGFGITYLGVDVLLEHRVAVKEYMPRSEAVRAEDRCTVRPATQGDCETFRFGLTKFLEEARMLARISAKENPRVVGVLNFFEANGTAYLVMRYLEGQPLSRFVAARGGHLPEAEAVYIATAILDGLREVHEHGLIHRDIKPHNVFVTDDGGIKLLDFGAARYAVGNKSKSLTSVLTPPYAPHEQYYEGGNQGTWTDVYAVGATLLQMLTGRLPPEAPARVEDDPLVPPRDIPGLGISRTVSDAVVKALAPKVSNRFRTVREFQAALTGSGRGEGPVSVGGAEAPPPSPPPPPVRPPEAVRDAAPPPRVSGPAVDEVRADIPPRRRRSSVVAIASTAGALLGVAIYLAVRPSSPALGPAGGQTSAASASPRPGNPASEAAGLVIGPSGDTVVDGANELVWQRTVSTETFSRSEAAAYCRALPLRGGNWRLPTRSELESLVRRGVEPAIDPVAFPQKDIGEWFWTSTRSTGSAGRYWCVAFNDGSAHEGSDSNYSRVRCVRRSDQ